MSKNEAAALRILEEFRMGVISRLEASQLLLCSQRAISRRVAKLRSSGVQGIKHGNYQRASKNKLHSQKRDEMLRLAKEVYFDFNMSHCLEMLKKNHDLETSYTTFHRWCRQENVGKRKRRRSSKARVYRERMACEGLMLQMDGSHHAWNGKDKWCLIAMIDDATSDIPAAKFFAEETTIACMQVLRSVIETRGVPQIIYTDKAGWAGGGKRESFPQFVRACEELGTRVITTSSPESKGRIERVWRTTQDRLIPELRLMGIKGMTDANRYLDQVYLPSYWQCRNTVLPSNSESRYRSLRPEENLDEILCIKHIRLINRNHTINFDAKLYKIKDTKLGNLSGKQTSVHLKEDGSITFYYGHIRLEVQLITPPKRAWSKRSA